MRVRVENTRAKVIEATAEELDWLDQYLCFEDKARFFAAKRSRYSKVNPNLYLLDKRNNTFPSGLVSLVQRAVIKDEIDVELLDARKSVCTWDADADLDWLYDYQFDCVWVCLEKGNGICQLPTGAGKTEIMVGLALGLPCHWLFIVHRTNLMHQAAERWRERTGLDCGIVGEGEFRPDPNGRLTCCSFQTLELGLNGRKATKKRKAIPPDPRVKKLLGDGEGLLIDECHTCAAETFMKVAMSTRRARYRLGFSGTPLERGDRRSVYAVAVLGPIIYIIEEEFLIQRGVLARPIIRAVRCGQECNAKNWQKAYSQLIVSSKIRNSIVVKMAMRAAQPMLVFCKEVAHGKYLCDMLNKAGIRAEFQWGEKKTPQREAAVKRLRYGEIDAIVCSVIFQEGVDIPELAAVVNGAGMLSTIATLQRMGRGMRSDHGRKETFEVWDIKDEGNRFMARHANGRLGAYRKRGHPVELMREEDL